MSEGSATCCDRTAAALREGREPTLGGCATCRALVVAARAAPLPEPAGFDVGAAFAGMEATLAAEAGLLGRARALPTWARLLGVLAAVAVIGGLNGLFAPRPDLAEFPLPRMSLVLALFVGGAWAGACGALWPLQRPPLKPLLAAGLALLGLAIPLAVALAPEAPVALPACAPPPGMFRQKVVGCLVFGSLCATPALVAVAVFARSALSVSDGLIVASVGALCGQVGLQLHCPIVGGHHMLAGHVPVVLALNAVVCLVLVFRRRARA